MFRTQKTTVSDFITTTVWVFSFGLLFRVEGWGVHFFCCYYNHLISEASILQLQLWTSKSLSLNVATLQHGPGALILPVSRIRRWSSPGWRKASSLHERICVPTSSELVASILALSSFKFTPAMEATSLMSSSSLQHERWMISKIHSMENINF